MTTITTTTTTTTTYEVDDYGYPCHQNAYIFRDENTCICDLSRRLKRIMTCIKCHNKTTYGYPPNMILDKSGNPVYDSNRKHLFIPPAPPSKKEQEYIERYNEGERRKQERIQKENEEYKQQQQQEYEEQEETNALKKKRGGQKLEGTVEELELRKDTIKKIISRRLYLKMKDIYTSKGKTTEELQQYLISLRTN